MASPHYRSRDVNYSVLWNDAGDDVGRSDVFAYGVPGYINGSSILNGTDPKRGNPAVQHLNIYPPYEVGGASSEPPYLYGADEMANASCAGAAGDGNSSSLIGCLDLNSTSDVIIPLPTWQIAVFGFLAAVTIVVTIVGNLIVLLSFILERAIRQPTNYFIASLALSDLLIGSMSMPFYTVYLLSNQTWTLGAVMCDLWLSVDYSVCLISIYTVFAITVDRFCSVKIPAKYRNWRTRDRVLTVVAITWILPVVLFFTSIFGWQYFTGHRSVPDHMCYVQYLEEAIFSCILQVCYFWITLVVMIVLYAGIYNVALNLQRRAEAKRKRMTSLVSIAGQTMTRIGIGMSQHGACTGGPEAAGGATGQNLFSQQTEVQRTRNTKSSAGQARNNDANNHNMTSASGLSPRSPDVGGDDDRSSSPVFPSDTDHSSQSPARSPVTSSLTSPPPLLDGTKQRKKRSKRLSSEPKHFRLQNPPKGRKARKAKARNSDNNATSGSDTSRKQTRYATSGSASADDRSRDQACLSDGGPPRADYGTLSENRALLCDSVHQPAHSTAQCTGQEVQISTGNVHQQCPAGNGVHQCTAAGDINSQCTGNGVQQCTQPNVQCTSTDFLSGVQFIDQDSIKSLQSSDNLRQLAEVLSACQQNDTNTSGQHTPDSPIWKMRDSLIERRQDDVQSPSGADGETRDVNKPTGSSVPVSPRAAPRVSPGADSELNSPTFTPSSRPSPSPSAACEPRDEGRSAGGQREAGADDRRPTRRGLARPSPGQLSGSPLASIVKTVKRSKRGPRRGKQQTKQSRSENRARKALRTITVILGAFVLCWTPWHILSLIMGFTDNHGVVLLKLYDISYWLCYLNSPINPLCYAFANAQFKKTFIRILKMDWKRR